MNARKGGFSHSFCLAAELAAQSAAKHAPVPGTYLRHLGAQLFLLAILFFALGFAFRLLLPFIHPIILGTVLAGLFYPLQNRLTGLFHGRRSLAALTLVLLIAVLLVIPVLFMASSLVDQGITLTGQIKSWIHDGNLAHLEKQEKVVSLIAWAKEKFPILGLDQFDPKTMILDVSKSLSETFLRHGADVLGNVASILAYFFIMMFILFFLLRDGKQMIDKIKFLSPLRVDQEDRILTKVRLVSRSVLFGSLMTALLQGLVGGVGLVLVGIPGLFWGAMMGFASLIPVVGTSLVWLPAAAYLAFFVSWESAVFLALWSLILVTSIDNFLKPFLMRGDGGMSPFYIFLAILGGLQLFGLAGILYGPLIIAFAMVMLSIYEEEFQSWLHDRHTLRPQSPSLPRAECSKRPWRLKTTRRTSRP